MSTDFGKRLKAARIHAGLSQEQLAARVGIAQSTLGSAEARAHGTRVTAQLAVACGVNPHWLATGDGEMLDLPASKPPQALHTEEPKAPYLGAPVARQMSHLSPMIAPVTIAWEQIKVGGQIPDIFVMAIPDDALAPHTPRGTRAIFVKGANVPDLGRAILIEGSDGQRYVRRYIEAPDGGWVGGVHNSAYRPIASTEGATILAWAQWKDDTSW